MVTAFVRAPQTHVIRRCAAADLRPASYIRVVPCAGLSPSGAASVATFPRHLMVEYGVPAGEASTAVARSQAVWGWGTQVRDRTIVSRSCTQVGRRLAWLIQAGSRD